MRLVRMEVKFMLLEKITRSLRLLSKRSFGLVLTCLLILSTFTLADAFPISQTAEEGQAIFQQKCRPCHTIGSGKLVGPDLKDVTKRRDLTWIQNFISAPDKVIASGDATAVQLLAENGNVAMPNLGLTPTQVEALLAYLENPGAVSSATAPALPVGDPLQGEMLFKGAVLLENGGPNCIACHSVASVTPLGGGTLGPDLTHVFTRYGPQGLASALNTLPFPTMQGVFANRPLTSKDQADLYAFFEKADQFSNGPLETTNWFWIAGIAASLVLFGVMAVFWPGQRQSLSDKLRRSA
jgi:mono/diheme cytochrome c family protein